MHEIGLTSEESSFIIVISSLASIFGPIILAPLAHKFSKHQILLTLCLFASALSYTSLLFIPKVIRTVRPASTLFDCTNNRLVIESCPNWAGDCNTHSKKLALSNFTQFALSQCKYYGCEEAEYDKPNQVCFLDNSRQDHCISTRSSQSKNTSVIEFNSRFDRWPLVDSNIDSPHYPINQTCVFQPNQPLIVESHLYQSISCRPSHSQCSIHCRISLHHRLLDSPVLARPLPCIYTTGQIEITFYSYLILRSLADFFLFTSFTLIDALSITLTNNYDLLYGKYKKVLSIVLPLSVWPIVTGFLIDYFSNHVHRADYSPVFVIFSGLILISVIITLCFPISPILESSLFSYSSISSLSPSSSNRRISNSMSMKNKIILISIIPFVLALGINWGLLDIFLSNFYMEMGATKLWLGLIVSIAFIAFSPFAILVKSLTAGVGRAYLIILGFVFYCLRFAGISFLFKPKWTLIPFHAMEAFSLPIAWIGVTSYFHHLLSTSPLHHHLSLQYLLNIIHFGIGRSLGALIWYFWLGEMEKNSHRWTWLAYDYSSYQLNANLDVSKYRLLLRLFSLISAIIAVVFMTFYHLRRKKRPRLNHKPKSSPPQNCPVSNGNCYSRLMDKLSNRNHQDIKLKDGKSNGNGIKMIDAIEDDTDSF